MRWENSVLVNAPASVVWQLTIDVENWPSFTPTMRRVVRLDQGPVRVGSSARVAQPRQTPAVWTVSRLEPGREFTWQTRRPGLEMAGSHLLEEADGGCRNTLVLTVTGPLARPFGLLFGGMLAASLTTENNAFKARAEREPPSGA